MLRLQGRAREVHFQGSPNSTDDIPFLVGDPGRLADDAGWTAHYSLEDSLRSMMLPPLS